MSVTAAFAYSISRPVLPVSLFCQTATAGSSVVMACPALHAVIVAGSRTAPNLRVCQLVAGDERQQRDGLACARGHLQVGRPGK